MNYRGCKQILFVPVLKTGNPMELMVTAFIYFEVQPNSYKSIVSN